MKTAKAAATSEAACHCCGLLVPRQELTPWRERLLCRRMSVLDPQARAAEPTADEWVSGPYRYYYVTHEHPVCAACLTHLQAGGHFSSALRNRGKVAFLVLMALVGALIAAVPWWLPMLRSALWLMPGEGG